MKRLAAFLIGLTAVAAVHAQTWPNRPVRVVVAAQTGGPDTIARVVAAQLQQQLGQPFVVENQGGANGIVGATTVAKAAPDGYTLLVYSSGFVINPFVHKSLPYDTEKDLVPVTNLATNGGLLLAVHTSVPAKSLKEFIEQQRADPKKYIFGTSPVGSAGYFATEAIKYEAKLEGMLVVPYKGTSAAIADLLAGQVSALIDAIPSSYPLAKSGKLRLIAVTSAERLPMMADTPTVSESALPGFEMESWYGLWGPAKMPRELSTRIASEVAKAVRSKLATERLTDQGFKAVGSTPEQFSEYVNKEIARHARIVRDAKIKVQQ